MQFFIYFLKIILTLLHFGLKREVLRRGRLYPNAMGTSTQMRWVQAPHSLVFTPECDGCKHRIVRYTAFFESPFPPEGAAARWRRGFADLFEVSQSEALRDAILSICDLEQEATTS